MSYRYGLRNRPAMYGAVPKGYIPDSERPHERFRYGTIDYPTALSAEDLYRYELTFVEGVGAVSQPRCFECGGGGREVDDRNRLCEACAGTGRHRVP